MGHEEPREASGGVDLQLPATAGATSRVSSPEAVILARGLVVERGGRHLLDDVDLEVAAGGFLGILGPNGSGKTTLLRTLSGALTPSQGSVTLQGRPLREYGRTELARRIGLVPQTFSLDFKFTVEETVALGRYPHHRSFRMGGDLAESDRVHAALEALSIIHLADRYVPELSGGERQRVLIAQTLTQDTPVVFLDEPLNNLDLNHQLEVMQLLSSLNGTGRTIVVVLHDINMAAQYCHELALLHEGRLSGRGAPNEVLTPELILDVFATRVTVHREGGRPYITPLALSPARTAAGAEALRVHVITGGGAGSALLESLVHLGFSPTVGVVSVFDTDYQTAQRFGLQVVSAPPFQPLGDTAISEHRALVEKAHCVLVAPQVYGPGNLANLEVAAEALARGRRVIVITDPPVEGRDLTEGTATALEKDLLAQGARAVAHDTAVLGLVCDLALDGTRQGGAACG